ncbi:MAG: hypothetical protein LBT86_08065 [Deltaproteobacteria bacterium]|nr:hypothetical protein [Deltaproteobacteria bacterium]
MNTPKRLVGLKNLALVFLVLVISTLFLGSCGALPPQDPYNLRQAKDNLSRGNHWYQRGCHREAARFFSESLVYARLADHPALLVMAYNAKGAALLAQGQLDTAAQALYQALDLTMTLPNKPELDSVHGNMGSLAFKANRFQDAEQFWLEALKSAPEPRKAIYLANLARLYQTENRPERVTYTELALTASGLKDVPTFARADALALAAALAQERGETNLAWTYLNEALALDRQTENLPGLAQDLELAGQLQLAAGQIPEAAQNLDRSFYLWAALGNQTGRDGVNRLYGLLQQTHKQGYPRIIDQYQQIHAHPQSFDPLAETCP